MPLLLFLYVLLVPTAYADDELHVRIVEVAPDETVDFVEFVVMSGSGSVADLVVTDMDGTDSTVAQNDVTVGTGDRLVIYWGEGTDEDDLSGDSNQNGIRELYVADSGFSATDDQAVLMLNGEILDAVIWTNGDGTLSDTELSDIDLLVTAHAWTGALSQAGSVILGGTGISIVRGDELTDTDTKEDWVLSTVPTPGYIETTEDEEDEDTESDDSTESEDDEEEDDEEEDDEEDEEDESEEDATADDDVPSFQFSDSVYISEVLPNPVGDDGTYEFIELYNDADDSLLLTGWSLIDAAGKKYSFEEGTKIRAHSYMTFFRTETGITLNNDADTIQLIDPAGQLVSELEYESVIPEGSSISIIDGEAVLTETPTPGKQNMYSAADSSDEENEEDVSSEDVPAVEPSRYALAGEEVEEEVEEDQQNTENEDVAETLSITETKLLSSGTAVHTVGTVTASPGKLGTGVLYIAEEHSGIQIYVGTHDVLPVSTGDRIEVAGVLSSIRGEQRIKITGDDAIGVSGSRVDPQPLALTAGAVTKSVEGMLVTVHDTLARSAGSTFYLGSNELKVTIKASTGITKPTMKKGDAVTVTGIVSSVDGVMRILPRSSADISVSAAKKSSSAVSGDTQEASEDTKTASSLHSIEPLQLTTGKSIFPEEEKQFGVNFNSPWIWVGLAVLIGAAGIGVHVLQKRRENVMSAEETIVPVDG